MATCDTYSKILANMGANKKSTPMSSSEAMSQGDGEFTEPQLRPSSGMKNLLTEILGPSDAKKYSPMD